MADIFLIERWKSSFDRIIKSALDNPQCPKVEDSERRMKFILNIVSSREDCKFVNNVAIVEKSSKLSAKFRVEGNRHFSSTGGTSLNKSVEEYIKSVTHAPKGSQELALAYANRSAALFKARLISDCLLDIERAFQNNYPDNLKAKLYLRKAMCLQILYPRDDPNITQAFSEAHQWTKKMDAEKQEKMKEMLAEQEKATAIDRSTFSKWDYKKFMPKLSAENSRIPGLSDSVELRYSEKYGRHIVATKKIKPGEVIAVQKASLIMVQLNSRFSLCWTCGEQTWASIPCESCVEVVFCSEICRERGNSEHHNIECPVIASLIAMKWNSAVLIPIRLMVKTQKEIEGSFEAWKRIVKKIDAEKDPLVRGFTNNVLDPETFSSVYCLLMHHLEIRTPLTEQVIVSSILVAYLLATKTQFFGSQKKGDLKTLQSDENFVFTAGLLEKVILLSRNNIFRTHADVDDLGCRMIVPALSFFNHSCNSMVTRTDHSNYLASTALRPIEKGDQIFDTYGPNYVIWPRTERQTYFLSTYQFSCDCEACKNHWSQNSVLESASRRFDSHLGPVISELQSAIYNTEKRLKTGEYLVKSYGRKKNSRVYDVMKDVAVIAKIIQKLYRLRLQHNSLEIVMAQTNLWQLLDLTKNQFLSLD